MPSSAPASDTGLSVTGPSSTDSSGSGRSADVHVGTERDRRQLALALRRVRVAAGLDIESFARKAEVPAAAVREAEAGPALPSRAVLHGYLACAGQDGSLRAELRQAWNRVYERHQRDALAPRTTGVVATLPRHRRRSSNASSGVVSAGSVSSVTSTRRRRRWPDSAMWPDPAEITTPEQWSQLLEAIKNGAAMSYTEIAESSQELGHPLSRSRVHALCTKPALPANPDTVRTFILVCGGTPDDADRWHLAWQRLRMATDHRPDGGTEPTGSAPATGQSTADTTEVRGDTMRGTTTGTAMTRADRPSMSAACVKVAWSARTVPVRAMVPISMLLFFLGLLSGLFTGVTLTH
ncbi:helix-turn-helix transcriptional regulator [Lentzea sp. HUAS12]|uniref:helix-turn-helix domain-containing protein n=1 Tax=Lentzea sp. HUAS12 TaxID=2951806 RepID=UPI00209F4CA1|nr:helix-turn-helix transcriptional regulator [Lentzea sp. HUAS12]USX56396.1 helix-turn-helix domain-containing protein [Lentzea sp. HUAS12]